ncbi:MAG: hypothetical protein MJ215_01445, partial [Spirochaetia bacterium]|nr:hypothetical protein [Spirochaetia bacterium]
MFQIETVFISADDNAGSVDLIPYQFDTPVDEKVAAISGEEMVLTLYAQWFGTGIEDKVDGMVKSDVVIKNTGTVREYIRATITANWYDAEGNIVAPWSVDSTGKCSQGEFTGLTGTGWILGADGYYYYTYPV